LFLYVLIQAERRKTVMPVLESTDHITPRSAFRYRPLEEDADEQKQSGGKRASEKGGITPVAQRASRVRSKRTEEDEDIEEWKRGDEGGSGTKTKRRKSSTAPTAVPAPKTSGTKDVDESLPKATRLKKNTVRGPFALRAHPLLYLGLGMIVMLALWMLLTSVANWWGTASNDLQYGRPRTYQVDAYVGHNEAPGMPSHFIAINLHGRIEIIEFPGGDASKARVYIGPQLYGQGEDLVPVTLSFVDVKGNHQPDMIVHFQNTQIVYINEQGNFRPARPDELPAIQQYIQSHGS
jgi:hypothetical protein